MISKVKLGDVEVQVVKKNIKNVHLTVHPPDGKVRVAAPIRMNPDTIRVFVISKLPWIKQQQRNFCAQEREAPREYLGHESHYLWGKRYLLQIIEKEAAPEVLLTPKQLVLQIRPRFRRRKAARHT